MLFRSGNVSIQPNTPSGVYPITYTICEASPYGSASSTTNCSIATATITVNNPIVADSEAFPAVTTNVTTPTPVGSLLPGDTLAGVQVTTATTNVTPITTGPIRVDADGNVTIQPITPSGVYEITYTICEASPYGSASSTTNCSTATATITVNNPIVADSEVFVTPILDANSVTPVGSLLPGDTLAGVQVTTSTTNVTPITTGVIRVDADGNVTIEPNTPSGVYPITYTICEASPYGSASSTTNCSTATATITVANPIVADPEAFPTTTITDPSVVSPVGSLLPGDTLAGVQVTTATTNVTPITTGPIRVDADGNVTVQPNTPSGTYPITYTICEASPYGSASSTTNCSTATATITVNNPIVADPEVFPAVTTNVTTPTAVGSLLPGDTLAGVQVTTATTNVTPITTGAVRVDVDGNVTVVAGTPPGTYTITYTICEASPYGSATSTTNCSTATVTVIVLPTIDAVNDALTAAPGTVTPSVFNNDMVNGGPLAVAQINLTPISVPTGWTLNANGSISVATGTATGVYIVIYQICQVSNPTLCSTATATITVRNIISAVNDTYPPINGALGGSTTTVVTNDTLNGVPVVIGNGAGQVTIAPNGAPPAGLTLNPNGTITIAPGTAAGTYFVNYTICEFGAVPANCSSATVTILVTFDEELVVNQYVSPNGDGDNAFFQIDGIEVYPNNTVEIYNRWGVLVYDVTGYNNADRSFRGESEGRVTVSTATQLPEGTYYYILKYAKRNGDMREKAGYLYINR